MQQPIEVLRQYWGYDSFRPMQEGIIESVLKGEDTLALLPTGGGKSICFQVPALCREGICIVVSPLIALMKDQVENLRKRNIPAVAIYSGMPYHEIDRLLDNCVYGSVKFLYLSPERLLTEIVRERIKKMPVNLLAVDEAHCISQWGYDFRPPYLEIAAIREFITNPVPVLALTATATPEVVGDIQDKLLFPQQNVHRSSFARQNLAYVVRHTEAKPEMLLTILTKVRGSGVVYVRNRRKTKEIALLLQKKGIPADYYHAGLDILVRTQKQEAWINGQTRIMVSTNAFGMGIDKADVRVVVHLELPDNLEAYFQEAGRAGRDGKKAFAVLLYNTEDRLKLEKQYAQSFPELKDIRKIYRALGSYYQLAIGGGHGESYDFDLIDFARNFQFQPAEVFNALRLLEQEGFIHLSDAVYTPSSLLIKVGQEQLYDYMLKQPRLNRVLKIILRSYQGAFSNYVNIREQSLAGFLKISQEELRKQLYLLHKEGIIDYQPQRDQPQLVFLNGRLDADTLPLDHQSYQFRKKRQAERIRLAITYAEQDQCRSQQLLAYFGETDAPACNICDVCLETKKQALNNQDYERYTNKLELVLKRERLTLDQILDSFAPRQHEAILETLDFLLNEGKISQEDDLFIWHS